MSFNIRDEFEALLERYMPFKDGMHSLNETQGWTPGQIQLVRDWINASGYGFHPTHDQLEAADLHGRPFIGELSDRAGCVAQEVLLMLVTLRDNH